MVNVTQGNVSDPKTNGQGNALSGTLQNIKYNHIIHRHVLFARYYYIVPKSHPVYIYVVVLCYNIYYYIMTQLEIDISYDDIIARESEGEWNKVAPLRILSMDIEW